MTPMISIVMPVYQVENYIANSIKSVVNQTFSSYEIVLVNDGTKDKSIEIALTVLESVKVNYTVVNQINKGCAAARNTGIRKSKGEWVVCVDPDDIIAPNFLERLYDVCIKYKTDVGFCNWQSVDINNIFRKSNNKINDLEIDRHKILYSYLKRTIKVIMPGLLIRKDFLESNNLWFDENIIYGDDQHFIWRVLLSAENVAYIRDKLYNYLKRSDSIMTSSDINDVHTGFIAMKKLHAEINEREIALKKYLLSRWVFGALHASTRMMAFNDFSELAEKLDYKEYCRKLIFFPDLRISILACIMLISLRLFYKIGNLL